MSVAAIVGGVVLLALASGRFVEGAAGLSLRFRVSKVLIGALVIGFGTSLPELLVSGLAALEDAPGIAVGNVVGSNVANLTLILGAVALLAAPVVHSGILNREVPITIGAMGLYGWSLTTGSRLAGLVLLGAFGLATAVLVRVARRDDARLAAEVEEATAPARARTPLLLVAETVGGLVGTLIGAQLVVIGAKGLATSLGISEGFVGFTIVAVGTSLPELVTAIAAARRDEAELAVGNVFGSNLFNSLVIGGTVALLAPPAGLGRFGVAVLVMVATGLLVAVLIARGLRLSRLDGIALVVVYGMTVITVL